MWRPLTIIAVPPNNRPPDSNDSQRHTIIAPLNTVRGNVDCRILLTNGGTTFDFQVVDGFCLDGDASFILPDPDPNNDGTAEYQIWLELAGKPNGGANLTTCRVDATGPLHGRRVTLGARGASPAIQKRSETPMSR
jgi:hypothetical protein